MTDVTALIPIHREKGNREWLQQTLNSLGDSVVPLVLENDGEVTEAFNAGLREADTEFVLPFGADDVAEPGMVTKLKAAIWDVDVAYPAMLLVDETLQHIVGVHEAQQYCPLRLLQQNYITGGSLIRREKALDVGGYRDLESWEDWDLWVRMSKDGARFKAVPDAKFLYRQVAGSRNRGDIDWAALKTRIVGDPDPTADVAATFYCTSTPGIVYVRSILPARHLPGIARYDAALDEKVEEETGAVYWEFPMHRGTAVLQVAAGKMGALALGYLRDAGHKVLVETDDNYLAAGDADFRKRAQWGRTIGELRDSIEGHKWIVKEADGVICSTDFLAKQYRKVNPNVYVCPNQVDPDDWPELDKPDDGILRIGWFASPSHADDGYLIRRALEWASRQPNVQVVQAGLDPGWRFKHVRVPWTADMSLYRASLQLLDIGLAPVKPTPFTRGRSDLKWLEYSMAGAATICSDIECYDPVPDGMAVKAKDAAGFYKAVKHFVRRPDEARQMAAEARKYVLERRTIQANIGKWQEAIAA